MLHRLTTALRRKNDFWEDLDGLIESISKEERIVLGADLNGHVGEGNIGDEEIMGRYGAGTRNKEGLMVVDFGKWMDLAIVNTYFKKKDEHRVTYKSGRKAAPYGGMQNGSYGEKEKSRESKAKDTVVETEGDKLSRSV